MSVKEPRIGTLAIGDELLTGRIADTNTSFVGDALFARGSRLACARVVPDEISVIQEAVTELAAKLDFLVVFGGLGPTSDDKTTEAIARMLGCPTVPHEPSREKLNRYLAGRKRLVTAAAEKQLLVPSAAEAIANPVGLAPAFVVSGLVGRGGCTCFFLPGVPAEMKAIFSRDILPRLIGAIPGDTSEPPVWRCIGIPEAELQELLGPLEARLPAGAWLGYRTRFPENHVTLYRRAGVSIPADLHGSIEAVLRPFCYQRGREEPEEAVLAALRRGRAILVLAESCTGGLVAQRLTALPGASDHVWGSYVVYRREAKLAMLGVSVPTDEAAVSAQTTRELAVRALEKSGAGFAAAVTGYLGPTGGTDADPVGTLYLCVARAGARGPFLEKKKWQPNPDRVAAQWGAATWILVELLGALEKCYSSSLAATTELPTT